MEKAALLVHTIVACVEKVALLVAYLQRGVENTLLLIFSYSAIAVAPAPTLLVRFFLVVPPLYTAGSSRSLQQSAR